MKELTHVEIATDGACKGNPGPGGWGAVIRAGTREKDLSGGAADTTNNRMELTAVIEALNALKRPCRVTLSTDSRYVMDGLTRWIRSEEHTSELQSLMRISYAVFCLKKKNKPNVLRPIANDIH